MKIVLWIILAIILAVAMVVGFVLGIIAIGLVVEEYNENNNRYR